MGEILKRIFDGKIKPFSITVVIFSLGAVIFSGCAGFRGSMTAKLMRPTLMDVTNATYSTSSFVLPEYGIPGSIMILEGLISGAPRDRFLRELAAQTYYGYSLGYVENVNPREASILYLTGRDHALKGLWGDDGVTKAEESNLDEFSGMVSKLKDSDIGLIFWAADCWGSWLFLNLDNPDAIAEQPRVKILMDKAMEIDETYFYGGPHLFFGVFYGSRSPMFGGDYDKSRMHFEKALEISEGKMLLTRVFYARYLAVQTLDEDLFREQLGLVMKADEHILPGMEFTNMLARRQAEELLEKEEDLF